MACTLELLLGTVFECPGLSSTAGWRCYKGTFKKHLKFSVPETVRWDYCLLHGERCLSAERWLINMFLFLYSGSEKGSSVTETPVIKKHNGLHLTLPDAHDTDSGEETRSVLSHPKYMLSWERNVLLSCVEVARLGVRRFRSVSGASLCCSVLLWFACTSASPCVKLRWVPAFFYRVLWGKPERY